MCNLSENYYLRQCFLQRELVPTQSMVKKKMSPPLAAVYFNLMTPRLKELAGLKPLLGAGSDWYVPPEELLQGRAVMKPVKKQVLKMLNHQGISYLGTTLFLKHRKEMDLLIEDTLNESDIYWKNTVKVTTQQLWNDLVAKATQRNSERIMNDFNYFAYLYRQSIGKIEILFHESAVAEIRNYREKTLHAMQNKYENYLKIQATAVYEEYKKKLMDEKTRLKNEFIHALEVSRTTMSDTIHDHNVEKYKAVEIMRKSLQSQNLACQIYVALKEREECSKQTEELKNEHKKTMKVMKDAILTKDIEIHLEKMKDEARQRFFKIWQRKVCHVVKSFQMFVLYCLNMLPQHAEFFINMEKLMLLQINEILEDPNAASIIEVVEEERHDPVPDLRPFYLFCDRGDKLAVDKKLCPKHSVHSSASDIPAMIINKRCLYAACDNFTQFTDKIIGFIQGNRGDDADFKDDLVYEHLMPVKYDSSQRLLEVKLESSLLQVLQHEMVDMHTYKTNDPNKCNCHTILRTCHHCHHALSPTPTDDGKKIKSASSGASRLTLPPLGKRMELDHETEPKWDSYCKHVKPKKCSCAKTAKGHLDEYLPAYMRRMTYGPPEIPGYKTCSTMQLKALVKKAYKKGIPPVPVPEKKYIRVKDMDTQYYDPEYEELCTCYSQDEFNRFINHLKRPDLKECTSSMRLVGAGMSTSYLKQRPSLFAIERAHSLRNLIENLTDVKTIFKKGDCRFY